MNKIKLTMLLAASLLVSTGCSTDHHDHVGSFDTTFDRAFDDYKAMPAFKAFALAKDTEGNWAYGYGQNHSNQAEANTHAMMACEKRIGAFGVNDACRIYAEDNMVIY